jgi:hypothetical protein
MQENNCLKLPQISNEQTDKTDDQMDKKIVEKNEQHLNID